MLHELFELSSIMPCPLIIDKDLFADFVINYLQFRWNLLRTLCEKQFHIEMDEITLRVMNATCKVFESGHNIVLLLNGLVMLLLWLQLSED